MRQLDIIGHAWKFKLEFIEFIIDKMSSRDPTIIVS
jgi:hypothetical protein